MDETNTLGTPYVNARATARYVAELIRRGNAPLVTVTGNALAVQAWVYPGDVGRLELGRRADDQSDPWYAADDSAWLMRIESRCYPLDR